MAASESDEKIENSRKECRWQQEQLPEEIKGIVLEDQKSRDELYWHVFLL